MNFNFGEIIILLLWLLTDLRNLFLAVYVWQLKEYRVDRFRAFLATRSGFKTYFGFFYLAKIILFFTWAIERNRLGNWFFWLIALVFLFDLFQPIKGGWKGKRPKFTLRAIFVLFFGFLFQLSLAAGIFLIYNNWQSWLGAILVTDISLPFLISLGVGFWSLPSSLVKRIYYWKASRKIRQFPNLIVIGITGSFGKTSTKEFTKILLAKKYNVLATPLHCNTEIGVAKQILSQLKKDHEVYVVEMGAYRKGEIKTICNLVRPKIGVLTGINKQHLALFGSFENLLQAKGELLQSLPNDGFLVVNGDNSYCRQLALTCRSKKFFYSIEVKEKSDLWAEKIKVFKERIEFSLKTRGRQVQLKLYLAGVQNLSNFLAACQVALALGVDLDSIAESASLLGLQEGTMRIYHGVNKSFLIDDSYNSNSDGVLAALKYLKVYQGPKFFVFQPIIELGKEGMGINGFLIRKALEVCDQVFLTNRDFWAPRKQRITLGQQKRIKFIRFAHLEAQDLEVRLKKGSVVLFSGRESLRLLKFFRKKKII